ncbi:MAG TPA: ABC transporter ATP-binding protein [Gaiella sp.]|jgi:iron complex transport system ATP-binding protein|nr:ABC transporter ATP-binding protein [Gaiella sp.]
MSAISLERVTVTLGGREVVREVTAEIETGDWVALIGPNGAGKTSLLRAVAGLLPCDGSVSLEGASLAELGRRERAQRLALVPQEPRTPPWLTVAEYVLMGRTPYLRPLAREGDADHDAAARALSRLDLDELAERTLGTLSGGERQRVVVARALAQEASIVLLDEPTASLDIGHQQQALDLLDALRETEGLTLVAAMHDLTLAAQYADRVLLLDQGRVVADGAPAEVLTEEALAQHYGARVRVVTLDDGVAVLPARRASV